MTMQPLDTSRLLSTPIIILIRFRVGSIFFTVYNILSMYSYLVEFLGAAFFIYVIFATGNPLAIGAALALTILLTSQISGGHINPAVTIAMASAGKLPVSEVLPYCMAQIFGGLTALQLYKRYQL